MVCSVVAAIGKRLRRKSMSSLVFVRICANSVISSCAKALNLPTSPSAFLSSLMSTCRRPSVWW